MSVEFDSMVVPSASAAFFQGIDIISSIRIMNIIMIRIIINISIRISMPISIVSIMGLKRGSPVLPPRRFQ